MIVASPIRAALAALAMTLAAAPAAAPAFAQSANYMRLAANDFGDSEPVSLGVNKSLVLELPRAAGDVLVSNPAIADAVLRTSTRLYLIGVALGQSNVFLFDNSGKQIASFDVYVEADLTSLNQLLAEAIPDGYVRADALNGNIVLRGQVATASASARAQEITAGMLDGSSAGTVGGSTGGATSGAPSAAATDGQKNIVNLLTITGEEQVALKVTIAEVQRQVVKQLGINIGSTFEDGNFGVGDGIGGAAIGRGLSPFVDNDAGQVGLSFSSGGFSIAAVLQALDETNMIRTLAEPTLAAVSGETAEFLAGGEFGYAIDGGNDSPDTVEFKEFGVKLAFTPVVLSAGRISLKVRTSVSEITGSLLGVPTLSTRRAETTVEMPSGGAFVIGGLVQERTRRAASGFPVLNSLPILGALFSSKDFREDQTELVMIITPYLVKPTSPQALARPDDNLMISGDAQAYFQNRITQVYGHASQAPGASASGQAGFTFD